MNGLFCRAEGSDAGGQCDQARQAEVALTIMLTALVQPGSVFGGVCGGSCHSQGSDSTPANEVCVSHQYRSHARVTSSSMYQRHVCHVISSLCFAHIRIETASAVYLPLVDLHRLGLSADLLRLFMDAFRYMEHSQLQIPKALPPVAEEISSAALAAAALASSTSAVSDKEWKTLLGKLVSCLFSDM